MGALSVDFAPRQQNLYGLDLTESELDKRLAKYREDGTRAFSLTAYFRGKDLRYALVGTSNKDKWKWKVEKGLTASELKTSAVTMEKDGFRPVTISACPHDKAVRYSVVWVKEPPREPDEPVYPEKPTVVKKPGWEMLLDAPKEKMQEWLAEKKKAKHSVVWLDGILVADKPLFSALVALDDRAPDWKAFLDVKCPSTENINVSHGKLLNTQVNWVKSISGYHKNSESYAVSLWHPGRKKFTLGVDAFPMMLRDDLQRFVGNGFGVQVLRPYLAEGGVVVYAAYIPLEPGRKTKYDFGMTEKKLRTFLKEQREAGYLPSSLGAAPQDDKLTFTATTIDNQTNAEWEVDLNLTAATIDAKWKERAARGFTPKTLTAYPWDGTARYCVVWVKEPTK